MMFVQQEGRTVTMILRTNKIRRGDTIVEQVPDSENPYREVLLTEAPVAGELHYRGEWHPVKYFTGVDTRTRHTVKYTGTDYRVWQVVRETGR